ncbi:MAG: hypothetical protein NT016_00360 [Candidatus Aenigmarchaeota archaeon]|nr:hypothetical protein [Candidatus Aenigmarchaeota archaeon]
MAAKAENDVRERMVDLLEAHPEGLTILGIADALKLNRNTVTKYIYELSGANIIAQRRVGSAKLCFLAKPQTAKAMLKARKEAKVPGFMPIMALLPLIVLSILSTAVLAANSQSHPLSELTPIDTNLDMNQYYIINVTKLGIGTTSPVKSLDVVGDINATNSICLQGICKTAWPVGTVTSVGLSAPSELTVGDSPVTGSGTLSLTWTSQTANQIFASPSSGSGVPGFRTLVSGDLPNFDASKITTGTFSNVRLDVNIGFLNNTQAWAGINTFNNLKLGGNMDASSNSITGASWLNSTNFNASNQICVGNVCRTSWPANSGNTTNEIFAAVNNGTFQTGSELWNTTAQIRAAQTVNTTAEVRAAQTINTTNEVFAAVNNNTFQTGSELWNTTAQVQVAQTVNTSAQINAALNSTFTNQLGKNTTAEIRTAIYSTTMNFSNLTTCAEGQILKISGGIWTCQASTAGGNTSAEIINAVNATNNGFFNLTSWFSLYINNATERALFTADLFNTTAQVNTTAEVRAAQTINTTNEVFAAVNNNTFQTGTELWNTTAQIRAAQTVNTSAEVNSALNSTFTSQLGHNTTNEIFAAVNNNTFQTGSELWNTTAQVRAAQMINTTNEIFAAVDNNTFHKFSQTLNFSNLTTCGEGQILKINGGAWVCQADNLGGNTSADVITAVNNTNNGFFNLTSWFSLYINNATERALFTADLFNTTTQVRAAQTINTSSEVNAAINSTFTGQLGHNTTAEINAALNSTFTNQLGKNTSAEINAAINSTFTNQLGHNTSTEINAALNSSFFTLNRPWLGFLGIGNLSGISGLTSANFSSTFSINAGNVTGATTYNASYDAQLGHNTTTEINNALNSSFYTLNRPWLGLLNVGNLTAINGLTASNLSSTFSINWGNISNPVTYNASYMTNTYNASYDAQLGHNTTNEIFAAVNNNTFQTGSELWNTTAQVQAAQTVNTSAQINAALNSTFTGQLGKNTTAEVRAAIYSTTMNLSNITDPTDCVANNYMYGKTGALWDCRADLFNTTAQIQAAQTVNTTAQVQAAQTINTSAQVNAALNSTFTGQLGKNTTAEIRTAIYSTTMNFSNLTTCADTQILKMSGSSWTCQADNLGGNTSADVITAVNNTNNGFFNLTSWFTYYVNNVTERNLFTSTYNASYDAQLGHNTTNEIFAAVNNGTFQTGSELWNTTSQVQAAQTVNTTAQIIAAMNSQSLTWSQTQDFAQDVTFERNVRVFGNITNVNVSTLNVNGSIVSPINNTFNVGSSTNMWKDAYFGGTVYASSFSGPVSAHIHSAADITSGTLTNSLLDGKVYLINQTGGLTWANLSSWSLNNVWTGKLDWGNISNPITYNASYMTNTYNASYNAQLGHNTSAEVNAAINSTFIAQLGKNTTAEVRAAIYSTTMNLSNITDPMDCVANNYMYGKTGALWDCRADLFNTTAQLQAAQTINSTEEVQDAAWSSSILGGTQTLIAVTYNDAGNAVNFVVTPTGNTTAQIQAAQTINTSAQVNAALNSSFFTLNRPWLGFLGIGNVSAISGLTSANLSSTFSINAGNVTGATTYNASYDAQLGHNTTAEIRAAQTINTTAEVRAAQTINTTNEIFAAVDNGTFQEGTELWNTTAQVQAAQKITGNTSSEILSIAVSRTDWTTHDNYPTACGANQRIIAIGDTLTCANDLFNTTVEVRAAQTINTSAEINAALNSSFFTLNRKWLGTLGVGNVSGFPPGNVTGIGAQGNISMWSNTTGLNSSALYQYNGNIGIGTTKPLQELDVVGVINSTQGMNISAGVGNQLIFGGDANLYRAGANQLKTDDSLIVGLWVNASNVNASKSVNATQVCIGTDCRTAWPVAGGGTGNVTGAGSQGNVSLWYNGTALNSSAIFQKAGNIGIGTMTPGRLLEVNGVSRFDDAMFFGSSDNVAVITWDTPGTIFKAGTGQNLNLGANNADSNIVINTSGNVGIGTTSPENKLEVSGGGLRVLGGVASATSGAGVEVGYDGTEGYVQAYDRAGGSGKPLWLNYQIGNTILGTKVGVGTTAPVQELDVVGDINATGTLYIGTDTNLYRSAANVLKTDDALLVAGTSGMAIGSVSGQNRLQSSGTGPLIRVLDSADNYGSFGVSEISVGDTYAANSAPNGGMLVEGNVGIGTASPQMKLDVVGSMNISTGDLWFNTSSQPKIKVPFDFGIYDTSYNEEKLRWSWSATQGDYVNLTATGSNSVNPRLILGASSGLSYESSGVSKFVVNGTTGRVGIGTTAPVQELDVVGDINSTSAVYARNMNVTSSVNVTTVRLGPTANMTWNGTHLYIAG